MSNMTVQPMIAPDAEQMLAHLEHLFGGDLDGCHMGKIELAWSDTASGEIKHAAIFGSDDFDDLVQEAVRQNSVPNQNVYVGAALRKPDIPPFGRCNDADFFALTALYVDLDNADAPTRAKARYRDRGCPPTAAVVTGRHPHVRAQLWWRLETPVREPEDCRQLNRALAGALGGDSTVCNPSRVMRLAGSIAWPLKSGRQLERTELQTFADGRPRTYYREQIARAFPLDEARPESSPTASGGGKSSLDLGLPGPSVAVEALMAAIRAGDHWHNNLVRLVGHWIARGWSDEEILTAAGNLTLAGYTVDQTRQEVATMISGGREKWSVPNPARQIETSVAADIDLFDWTADRYTGEPEPIQWLCAGTIPLGEPGLIAAMGGLGKSYLALDLALSIAAGVAGFEQPKAVLGGRIAVEGTAVMLAAEDGIKAIHRRLCSIDPDYRRLRHPRRLIVVPMPNAGGPRPLIASDGKNLTKASFFESLSRQLAGIDDLRLIVIDPLQAFVLADVNADPAAAQFMWSAFAELCASTGATLLVTHHMRKDGGFRIRSADEARESVRGTTALIDGGRFAYALWKVDEAEGGEICRRLGLEPAPGSVARGAVIKANDQADFSEHTYIRQETGLLVQCESEPEPADRDDARLSKTKAHEILEEIQRRFDDGNPFSHAPNSGARYVVPFFTRQHGMRRDAARNLLADWINNGVVTVDLSNRKTKLMGLRVAKWV